MKRYSYKISGLDCPNCALKIENEIKKNEEFKKVNLNFSTLTLNYETDIDNSFLRVNEIIKTIEPDVKLVQENELNKEYHLSVLIISFIFGLIGSFLHFKFNYLFILVAYSLLLFNPFKKTIKMLFNSFTINENMLITISCLGALIIGKTFEGIIVSALYMLGKILEEMALNKTRSSIADLITIKEDYANLKVLDRIKKIKVEDVKIGDILCIKKGEKVPVDGVLVSGKSKLDTSALTGESNFLEAKKGTKVLSGFLNLDEVIYIKATSLYKNSMVSKILDLVENASSKKTNLETTVSKLSKIYTPIVLLLAILTAIFLPLFLDLTYKESVYRALTFLVIACPCAIVISTPLSYFIGIAVSSFNGILIKGSNYLDNMRNIKKIIFDKTGTLTTGAFEVLKIDIHDKNYSYDYIVEVLRHGESFSNHPIALAIMNLSNYKIDSSKVLDYKEITGVGISFKYDNKNIQIGSINKKQSIVDLIIDSKRVASINILDGLKENASLVISKLHKLGIETYMFTGDSKEQANLIGEKLSINKVYSNMLPTDKYEKYEQIKKEGSVVAFVGDGINDALVIKRSDIGISMGLRGSDSVILLSDVVVMNDNLESIITSINISKYTNLIIKENLIFALGIKFLILVLSIFGHLSMWFAVFADTGLTVLTILNCLRIMIKFKKK